MDQPLPHDPGDLGISDVEYERIVRDMRRRGHRHVPAPPPRRPQQGAPLGTAPRPRRRRSVIALGVALGVLLASRLVGSHQAPAYAFMETVNGQPVTYATCHPIQVAVYPAGGPPDAEKLVREAVATMRSATGLNIVVSGVYGGYAANWNFKAAPVTAEDPISVSWQDGDAIAELTDDIAGLGGSAVFTVRNGGKRYAAGTIALSRSYYATLAEHHDHAEELAVLLHEFGHVFGLAHVHARGELMNEQNIGRKTFGPGDLEGLRILGQGPCT